MQSYFIVWAFIKYKLIRAFTSVFLNFLSILHEKIYFFYFILSLLQNTCISLSILQDISIKYSFSSIYFIFISLNYPLPTYALSLSLYSFFLNRSPLSLSLSSIFSHSFSKTTNPNHFFIDRSRFFLHRPIHEPSSTTQILSSPADSRTKLHDPDHLFTGRSMNQAPQAPIYLFVGLSVWVCL